MRLVPFAIGSLVGATLLNSFCVLPQTGKVVEYSVLGFILFLIGIISNKLVVRQFCIVLLGVILGFGWSYKEAKVRLSWALPESVVNQSVVVKGKVAGLVHNPSHTVYFDLALETFNEVPLSHRPKVRLKWSKGRGKTLKPGDTIRGYARLKPLWALSNPGGADAHKQWFIEGLRASGKLTHVLEHKAAKKASWDRLRQRLSRVIEKKLEGKSTLGLIQALTLGVYKEITPNQWQIFQATGTLHALAISGLHIGLVALFFYRLLYFIASRFYRLTVYYPAQSYGAIGAILGATLYAGLAGFSVPTQRALIMVIIVMAAILAQQRVLAWRTLALAWVGVLISDPLVTLRTGFWLSFGCIAVLIYSRSKQDQGMQKWIMPQWLVGIGMLPLSVFFFKQFSVVAPLANIVILPWVSFIIVPASLLGLALVEPFGLVGQWCWQIAHINLTGMVWFLEKLAAFSGSVWHAPQIPFRYLLLAGIGGGLLLAPRGLPGKKLGVIGFLPLFLYRPALLAPGEVKFTLLDVGQGLAAVVQTRNHTLLYDAGPEYGPYQDAGQKVIKPFLHSQSIKRLDKIIISHADLDHRGGLKGLKDVAIGEIISSEPHRLKHDSRLCLAPEEWQWDGVKFAILAPTHLEHKKRNNLSCVLQITSAGQQRILLTGDIEKSAEKALIENFKAALSSDILVVPHHGSLTSSSFSFVQAVSPRYALYPVGYLNQYGFPKGPILDRYHALGSENLLAFQTGALIFQLDQGPLLAPIQWRKTHERYWQVS